MSKKIHSQDSNSDIEWDMKALYDSFRDASDDYKKIIKAFNNKNLSLLPFAKAIDITGEGSIELIEAFEIRKSPVETSLPDANWVSLQNICNS